MRVDINVLHKKLFGLVVQHSRHGQSQPLSSGGSTGGGAIAPLQTVWANVQTMFAIAEGGLGCSAQNAVPKACVQSFSTVWSIVQVNSRHF